MGTPPKLGWNRGGGRRHNKPAISLKQCKTGPRAKVLSIGTKNNDLG